jgi:photosystem II stability/assembly factor-like uncharacterized protein
MKTKDILAAALFLIGSTTMAQNWFTVTSGTTNKLNAIDFLSPTIGYIGGNQNTLLKTTNGGQTWNPITPQGITTIGDITSLDFVTENVGFITLSTFNVYKTTDGGTSWTSLQDLSSCFNEGMYFTDENNGFIGGSGCFSGEIINKLNANQWSTATINAANLNSSNRIVGFDFLPNIFGLAASTSGYILRTTDQGENWDTISTSASANPLTDVLIVNANLCYASYETENTGFGLYISTDGGLSWQEDINSATFFYPNFFALHKSGNDKIYVGGKPSSSSGGLIYENIGDGVNWNYTSVDTTINDFSSHSDSVVFGVGDNGYIIVNQDFSSVGMNELINLENKIQCYPNPVSSELQFKNWEPLTSQNAIIQIVSITGQTVYSERFQSTVNLEKLSPGIYLVKFETINGTITKKIVKE